MEDTLRDLAEIERIHTENQGFFRFAIAHLFEAGAQNFTPKNVNVAMKSIDDKHDEAEKYNKFLPMTRPFEKGIMSCATELSKINLWSILLYIKKAIDIYDPAQQLQEDGNDD